MISWYCDVITSPQKLHLFSMLAEHKLMNNWKHQRARSNVPSIIYDAVCSLKVSAQKVNQPLGVILDRKISVATMKSNFGKMEI